MWMAGWEVPRRLLWPSLAFIGALLVLAPLLALFERWRKRPPAVQEGTGDQLAHFRTLYERGEISQEEYDRIHARLSGPNLY